MDRTQPNGYTELLPDGKVFILLKGDLGVEALTPILAHAEQFMKGLGRQGFPIHVIVNVQDLTNVRLDSRKHGVEWLKTAKYDKVAVFGSSTFMKYFVNMLIRAIGNPMRYFTTKEDAENWLKE